MGLFDRFKKKQKKWEDEDPEVRIEGIRELSMDLKNWGRNMITIGSMIENDPDIEVRLYAVKKAADDKTLMDAALNNSEWKVREAAVEMLKEWLDSNRLQYPKTHYTKNEEYINLLKEVGEKDSNMEVRGAANSIVYDQNYNKRANLELYKDDMKKVNYTVIDESRGTEKTITLTLNKEFEYVYEANSVRELFDCCRNGDAIAITYENLNKKNSKDLIVRYGILDKELPHADKRNIEGTAFDRMVTDENVKAQIISITDLDGSENQLLRDVLRYHLQNTDKFFMVSKWDEIKMNTFEIEDFLSSQGIDVRLYTQTIEYRVIKIEFICKKTSQIRHSEEVTVYR